MVAKGIDMTNRRSGRPLALAHTPAAIAADATPPTKPAMVLWGLMVGASLGPPAPRPPQVSSDRGAHVLVDVLRSLDAAGIEPGTLILLTAKGDLLRTMDAPPLADGRLRMPLPVASLANAAYILRITATAGEQSAEQWVAFRVAR